MLIYKEIMDWQFVLHHIVSSTAYFVCSVSISLSILIEALVKLLTLVKSFRHGVLKHFFVMFGSRKSSEWSL